MTAQSTRTRRASAKARSAPNGEMPRAEPKLLGGPPPGQRLLSSRLREHIDPALRAKMVAEAAYFYAERRGFAPGHELEDWLAAEDQIVAALALADQRANEEPASRES